MKARLLKDQKIGQYSVKKKGNIYLLGTDKYSKSGQLGIKKYSEKPGSLRHGFFKPICCVTEI